MIFYSMLLRSRITKFYKFNNFKRFFFSFLIQWKNWIGRKTNRHEKGRWFFLLSWSHWQLNTFPRKAKRIKQSWLSRFINFSQTNNSFLSGSNSSQNDHDQFIKWTTKKKIHSKIFNIFFAFDSHLNIKCSKIRFSSILNWSFFSWIRIDTFA